MQSPTNIELLRQLDTHKWLLQLSRTAKCTRTADQTTVLLNSGRHPEETTRTAGEKQHHRGRTGTRPQETEESTTGEQTPIILIRGNSQARGRKPREDKTLADNTHYRTRWPPKEHSDDHINNMLRPRAELDHAGTSSASCQPTSRPKPFGFQHVCLSRSKSVQSVGQGPTSFRRDSVCDLCPWPLSHASCFFTFERPSRTSSPVAAPMFQLSATSPMEGATGQLSCACTLIRFTGGSSV